MLCLIDDAQWLDRSSADALVFAARRLHAEPIVILIASPGGRRATIRGERASRRCVYRALPTERRESSSGCDLPGPWQIPRWSHSSAPRSEIRWRCSSFPSCPGRAASAQRIVRPSSGAVEKVFRARVERLPDQTRRVLLLAAADDGGDLTLLRRAAADLGSDLEVLEHAADEGLVTIEGAVAFRHPLIRSAVYGSATPTERRAVHAALAAALDNDPGRRAWHRADACEGEDDAVAAELESTGDHALGRGAHAAAAAAFERSADLSGVAHEKGRRLARAAHAALDSGRRDTALSLAERADPLVADPLDRAELEVVRAAVDFHRGIPDEAHRTLMDGAVAIADSSSTRGHVDDPHGD